MSRRDQIRMTDEEVDAFIHERRTMNVATFNHDGSIHLVAMWYGFLDGKVAFWTFAKSQKILNLRRSPLLSALAEEGMTYATLKGVELVGQGRLVEDRDQILAIGLSVAERHNGPAAASAEARPFLEAQAAKRLGVVIDVDKVVSWDHTKLDGAY